MGPPLASEKKIALIRSSSIGDVVLATSCLTMLRRAGLLSEVVWFGRQPSMGLLQASFPEVTFVDISDESAFQQVKSLKLVVDLQTNLRSLALTTRLVGHYGCKVVRAKKSALKRSLMVLGARLRSRSSSNSWVTSNRQYEIMLEALRCGLEEAFGLIVPTNDCQPHLPIKVDAAASSQLLPAGYWIGIVPGSLHPPKRLPLAFWPQIMRSGIPEATRGQTGLVFLGGADEREICDSLIENLMWPGPVRNLAGQMNLAGTAQVIAKCRFILSNDSALAHVAEAVGVPVGVFFGPTHESFGFAPWRSESRAFSRDLGCRPCSKHGKKECRFGDYLCFRGPNISQAESFVFHQIASSEAQ